MNTHPCPACGEPILVVQSSRWGGTLEAFDPKAGDGDKYDTLLDAQATHIVTIAEKTTRLRGLVPLYRKHLWSCSAGMRVPGEVKLPAWGGYSHAASTRKLRDIS